MLHESISFPVRHPFHRIQRRHHKRGVGAPLRITQLDQWIGSGIWLPRLQA